MLVKKQRFAFSKQSGGLNLLNTQLTSWLGTVGTNINLLLAIKVMHR